MPAFPHKNLIFTVYSIISFCISCLSFSLITNAAGSLVKQNYSVTYFGSIGILTIAVCLSWFFFLLISFKKKQIQVKNFNFLVILFVPCIAFLIIMAFFHIAYGKAIALIFSMVVVFIIEYGVTIFILNKQYISISFLQLSAISGAWLGCAHTIFMIFLPGVTVRF